MYQLNCTTSVQHLSMNNIAWTNAEDRVALWKRAFACIYTAVKICIRCERTSDEDVHCSFSAVRRYKYETILWLPTKIHCKLTSLHAGLQLIWDGLPLLYLILKPCLSLIVLFSVHNPLQWNSNQCHTFFHQAADRSLFKFNFFLWVCYNFLKNKIMGTIINLSFFFTSVVQFFGTFIVCVCVIS